MNARRYLWPFGYFCVVLAAGTLAGRAVDGVLSVVLAVLVAVASPLLLAVVLIARDRARMVGDDTEDCARCGGPVEAGVDYCTDYCREAEAREERAWERTAMFWEVDAPDGHVVYRGADVELASELYHSEPPGAHLHLTPRPVLSGGVL